MVRDQIDDQSPRSSEKELKEFGTARSTPMSQKFIYQGSTNWSPGKAMYPEEENTWEPAWAVQYLRKLIITFHKDHPAKPTATSPPANNAP